MSFFRRKVHSVAEKHSQLSSVRHSFSDAPLGNVVFVHGLGGDPMSTWKNENGIALWDWLSEEYPEINFWTIGYESSPIKWSGGHAMPIIDRATNILATLDGNKIGSLPIYFIAHSMGGILVKQIIKHAAIIFFEYKELLNQIKGISFLSTPHTGSDLATIASYLSCILKTTPPVKDLEANASMLRELNAWFRNNVDSMKINVKTFFETKETMGIIVVNATSADPGIVGVTPIPVDATHVDICKPRTRQDVVYTQISKHIKKSIIGDIPKECQDIMQAIRMALIQAQSKEELESLDDQMTCYLHENPSNVAGITIQRSIRKAIEEDKSRNVRRGKREYARRGKRNIYPVFGIAIIIAILAISAGRFDKLKNIIAALLKMISIGQ